MNSTTHDLSSRINYPKSTRKLTLEVFTTRGKNIHEDKYDYSKVNYINNRTKVCIICPDHGEFWQTPGNHVSRKSGCPVCGKLKERKNSSETILLRKFKGLIQPNDYKLIPLTQGEFAKVDNEDFERVKDINWSVDVRKTVSYAYNSEFGYMHRYIMNALKGLEVDHINHYGLDNRKSNLRLATPSQNKSNIRKSSVKLRGVQHLRDLNKWVASIKNNNINIYLGRFLTEEEAGRAYDEKAIELKGEFAYETLNFPELLDSYLKEIKNGRH